MPVFRYLAEIPIKLYLLSGLDGAEMFATVKALFRAGVFDLFIYGATKRTGGIVGGV